MPRIKPDERSAAASAALDTRARILAAAERLLRADGSAEFSMRQLAAEAGLSFATPFNQFGSKTAIMQALSAQRIALMERRLLATRPPGDAADRILAAVHIAAEVLLEEPGVNRAVIGSLGSPAPEPGRVAEHSGALWAAALGDGDGLAADLRPVAGRHLPTQLALGFRGCLSFWVAGEIEDAQLPRSARQVAAGQLLGFVPSARRLALLAAIED